MCLAVISTPLFSQAECADSRPLVKNLYFGDLHAHTSYSMDAYFLDTRATPWDAYAFARGAVLGIGPLDESGQPSVYRQLAPGRELDFSAVTDHAEYIGEAAVCTEAGVFGSGYDEADCVDFRGGRSYSQFWRDVPDRLSGVCGPDGEYCNAAMEQRWVNTIAAANDATVPCEFTAFIGYEWTPGERREGKTHRNVIFRNDQVPPLPHSAFTNSDRGELWRSLDETCAPGSGCQAITIPHNTNLAAGNSLTIQYPEGATLFEQQALAGQRLRFERLLELTQHKGTSECVPGLASDEDCDFELFPCPGETCMNEGDTFRGALKAGLVEWQRIGINPLKLGAMASTDSHNGTMGDVGESNYAGHSGRVQATPYARLTNPDNPYGSPGGLLAVWAVQNTRDAIFDAMLRREVYGTSGPRIGLRFFAGSNYIPRDCRDAAAVIRGYRRGTPMGSEIKAVAPRMSFMIQISPDAVPIERVQLIKGYVDAAGVPRETMTELPRLRHAPPGQLPATCDEANVDCASLCGVVYDHAFEPQQASFYYLRVLEYPTYRWSKYDCESSEETAALPNCQPGVLPETIRERAWSSPIWYSPRQ
jgi:hypothetical protein